MVTIGCDGLCRGSLWLGVVVAGCAVVVGSFDFGQKTLIHLVEEERPTCGKERRVYEFLFNIYFNWLYVKLVEIIYIIIIGCILK